MSGSIVVNRFKNSPFDLRHGTFGYIDVFGLRVHTVEQPWTFDPIKWPAGKPNESCVPAGSYDIVERYSNRKQKNMFYLVNESLGVFLHSGPKPSDRGSCMFHRASRGTDIEGCVGLGVNMINRGGTPVLDNIGTAEDFIYDFIKTFGVKKCTIQYA